MMVFLVANVLRHVLNVGLTDGKRPIAILPMKSLEVRSFRLDPFGRTRLQLFDNLSNRRGARQAKQGVNVIDRSVHSKRRTTGAFEHGRAVRVQFRFDLTANPGLAVLGAENQMHHDRRE